MAVKSVAMILIGAAATENPAGELRPGLDPSQVSPGLLGFLATFALVAGVIALILDFNRRNRRLTYRAKYAEQRAQEDGIGGYASTAAPAETRTGSVSYTSPTAPSPTPRLTGHSKTPPGAPRAGDTQGGSEIQD